MRHEFVECMPDRLDESVLYISLPFATAMHKCACGCGQEVVTPLSPTDWSITFDGETVSLNHSIGNWSFACRSHYLIKKGRVIWVGEMSDEDIARGRASDVALKAAYFKTAKTSEAKTALPVRGGTWDRFLQWLQGR